MEYFYHYTTSENWKKIQSEGLNPARSIEGEAESDAPGIAKKPAIFGLPLPAPESWLMHGVKGPRHGPYPAHRLLAFLLRTISGNLDRDLVLLKVRLKPGDDVRVGDYESIWKTFNRPSGLIEAMAKYCESVTKLKDNFNAVAAAKLPEILCFNHIPADRVELIEKIPIKSSYWDTKAYAEKVYVEEERKTGNNSPAAANAL